MEQKKIDVIKHLYSQVLLKKNAINAVAKATGIEPLSVANHYLSCNWAIPSKKQDNCIKALKNVIKAQDVFNKTIKVNEPKIVKP